MELGVAVLQFNFRNSQEAKKLPSSNQAWWKPSIYWMISSFKPWMIASLGPKVWCDSLVRSDVLTIPSQLRHEQPFLPKQVILEEGKDSSGLRSPLRNQAICWHFSTCLLLEIVEQWSREAHPLYSTFVDVSVAILDATFRHTVILSASLWVDWPCRSWHPQLFWP